jgi:hypothetical protein
MQIANEFGLSEKVMQSKLAQSLKNNGTLDSLKVLKFQFALVQDLTDCLCEQSQLRAKVLSDIRAGGIVPVKRTRSLLEEAALQIVLDHLRLNGYRCSLSVFLPESGLSPQTLAADSDKTRFSGTLGMIGVRQVRQTFTTLGNCRLNRLHSAGFTVRSIRQINEPFFHESAQNIT